MFSLYLSTRLDGFNPRYLLFPVGALCQRNPIYNTSRSDSAILRPRSLEDQVEDGHLAPRAELVFPVIGHATSQSPLHSSQQELWMIFQESQGLATTIQ
jgi:hypothetical protein